MQTNLPNGTGSYAAMQHARPPCLLWDRGTFTCDLHILYVQIINMCTLSKHEGKSMYR